METFSALLALCEGNHRSSVDSAHKGQWSGALVSFGATALSGLLFTKSILQYMRHQWPILLTSFNFNPSNYMPRYVWDEITYCPACRTTLVATRFWVVMICPIIKCLTVLEFSFILFDLCLFITIFNFILNYVPIVTFWIFTYHKILILLIIFCFIWSYWIIYFLTCLEVFWSVVS